MTIQDLKKKKQAGQKITMVTAYDCPFARMADMAGIDTILVGDSVGNNVLGYGSTVPVTMEEMIHHVKAVTRGAKNSWVIADMPYMSYQVSIEEAVRNAGRFMKECDADAVKLEGGVDMADVIRAITRAGIPVVAHIGLTPQSVALLGGFKVQGKTAEAAKQLLEDAKALQAAGAVMIVLEAIPADVAKFITENIDVPTIGIGAGPHCDGQVLVMHDLLGLNSGFVPKFCKQYVQLEGVIVDAFAAYKNDVETGAFPEEKHCFTIKEEELKRLY